MPADLPTLQRSPMPRQRLSSTGFMEYRRRAEHYSALMLADLITLPHFSVSSAMSLPKSAGDIGIGTPPRSARPALIASLSLSTISAGVFLGTPTPYQKLAS